MKPELKYNPETIAKLSAITGMKLVQDKTWYDETMYNNAKRYYIEPIFISSVEVDGILKGMLFVFTADDIKQVPELIGRAMVCATILCPPVYAKEFLHNKILLIVSNNSRYDTETIVENIPEMVTVDEIQVITYDKYNNI